MNVHEKCFESSLDHYQNRIRKKGGDFYWHRPHKSYLIISFNFQKKLSPAVADNFAVNIKDAVSYFNSQKNNVLRLEDYKLWKGIELMWKPRSNSYNLDPIMLPKNRIFNARRTKMRYS